MQQNIKKEKSDYSILTANLNSKKNLINKSSTNVSRPDTLEIKVKQDIHNKSNVCNENVNWSADNFDNFINHIKNVNNTPSPITPNSFFNPSDVTQDQEQFADTLTVHLNKIKEEYKSSIESSDSTYLNNVIQLASVNDDRPLQIATVSVGNKVYLVNTTMDDNNSHLQNNSISLNNTCLNYGVIDLQNNLALGANDCSTLNAQSTIILQKNPSSLSQQLKLSNLTSLRNQCVPPNIVFSSPQIQIHQAATNSAQQFNQTVRSTDILSNTITLPLSSDLSISQHHSNHQDLSLINSTANISTTNEQLIQQPVNFIKAADGLVYTRIPDSSQSQLLNQLNNLAGNNLINNHQNISHLSNNINSLPSNILLNNSRNITPMEIINNNTVINQLKSSENSQIDSQCLSVNSSATESSSGINNNSSSNPNGVITTKSSIKTSNSASRKGGMNSTPNSKSDLMKDDRDLDEQQRRLERKRARNRDAARKCRDRKNSLILTLEQKYTKQCEEKEIIRDKLCKSLEEIRRLTDYIAKHDPNSKFSSFTSFLQEIKIHELTETDLKDLNLL